MAASRRVSSPTLVGRREEVAAIRTAIAEIAPGRPRVVVISGEAGVGKTRLIEESVAELADRVRVLRGHCLSLRAELPYLPFAEMIRDLVRELSADAVRDLLGPGGPELAQVVPELKDVVGSSKASMRGGSELQRLRLFESLLRVAERIALDRPTVFVFEDLQWIDSASLQLLAFLSHSVRRSDVVLVVTVRTEALTASSPVLPFLAELERGSGVLRIELDRLGREATRRQIAAILDTGVSEALVDRIWQLGDGNPLFTEELVAAASIRDDLGSPQLRDLLAARTAQLPKPELRILRVAAVLGRDIDVDLLTAASGIDRGAIDRATEAGLQEQVLVRGGGGGASFRFRHELLRSVLAEQLGASEARDVHAAYARAMEAQPDADASAIAYHWDGAGVPASGLRWHARAGFDAEARYAYAAALRHYERVLRLWTTTPGGEEIAGASRSRFLQRASTAAARAGQHDRAIDLAQRFLDDATPGDDLTELMRSSLRWYLWEAGRTDEALAEAEDSVTRLSRSSNTRWAANATAHLAGLLLVADEVAEARRHAEDALRLARDADAIEEEVLANGIIGGCLLLEGDVDAGIERIGQTVESARRIEQADADQPVGQFDDRRYPVGVVLASTQLAAAYAVADRPEEAVRAAESGYARAVDQGVARTYGATLRAASARSLYRLGRWDEALGVIDDALGDGASGSGRVGLLALGALIHTARGDLEEADAALRTAENDPEAGSASEVMRWLAVARCERLVWEGRPLEALPIIAGAYEAGTGATRGAGLGQAVGLDASLPQLLAVAARVSADLALHERAGSIEAMAARASGERVRSAIRRTQRRPGLAASWALDLALAKAELARAEHGQGRRAVDRWRHAATAAKGRPYVEAYARWRLAAALLGDRRRTDEASLEIERASASAAKLRARPLGDAIEQLARRAGLGTDRTAAARDRPFGLTARELEVLGLLAAGLGNGDIAERLFISPKTASVHVSNIYGKLGVESRVAAATMANDLGLAVDPDTQERPVDD